MTNEGIFQIEAENLRWINGPEDDPEDLCLHGDAVAFIGSRRLEYDGCTVSSTALSLLKTLTEDHLIGHDNQMLPCCGHFLVPNEDLSGVAVYGCCNGTDWSVIHEENAVRLITEDKEETVVPLQDYERVVFRFADQIEAYYNACAPKICGDPFDRDGYTAFWNEWHRRWGKELPGKPRLAEPHRMKRIVISADGDRMIYAVPEEVADHLETFCSVFLHWLRTSPDVASHRDSGGLCYRESDFIDWLNRWQFPEAHSYFVRKVSLWNAWRYWRIPKFYF